MDGNDTSNHVCQCGNDLICIGGCHCNHQGQTQDEGTITLKSILPIRKFNYGPLEMEGKSAHVSIGSLKCQGTRDGRHQGHYK